MEAGQNQPGGSGWNDPPNLSFKIHSETKKRKNLLNKRVCYFDKTQVENRQINLLDPNLSLPPSTGLPTSSGLPPTSGLPTTAPPLPSTGLLPPSSGPPIEADLQEDLPKEDEIASLHSDWINGFRDLANKCDDNLLILQKINKAENMNESNQLSKEVHLKMKKLLQLIHENKFDDACNLQVQLMCDYTNQVRLWMVGIKKLIFKLKTESEKEAS